MVLGEVFLPGVMGLEGGRGGLQKLFDNRRKHFLPELDVESSRSWWKMTDHQVGQYGRCFFPEPNILFYQQWQGNRVFRMDVVGRYLYAPPQVLCVSEKGQLG